MKDVSSWALRASWACCATLGILAAACGSGAETSSYTGASTSGSSVGSSSQSTSSSRTSSSGATSAADAAADAEPEQADGASDGTAPGDGGRDAAVLDGARDGSSPADGGADDAADTGATGDAGYDPCPTDGSECKILPLGDSITYGVGDPNDAGYRGPLFALTVAAGQKVTFTGSVMNGPTTVSGQPFPQRSEGHSGWSIWAANTIGSPSGGIGTVIPNPAFANSSGGTPDIILLFIGTNDLGNSPTDGGSTAADMAYHLGILMDKIIADAPNALLVVAQITPLPCCGYGSVVPQYNALIPGLAQTRVAAGKHVLVADMYTGFDASTMIYTDKIHPNSAGYNLIANRWYSAIQSVLPR